MKVTNHLILGSAALALSVLALPHLSSPARAQFVCGQATTGDPQGAAATGVNAFACGANSNASGADTTAIGSFSAATGLAGTATGAASKASGTDSTASGTNSQASGFSSTATGVSSTASGDFSTATGAASIANGNSSTATGYSSSASGISSTATGNSSSASGIASTAYGAGSSAGGAGSVAIGASASAAQDNTVAIGQSVATTRTNQVAIGSATNTYTLAGIASAASLAAQSGPTKYVTTDANGNLAASSFGPADIAGLSNSISSLQANVAALQGSVRRAYEGTAIAMAMSGAALPDNKTYAVSANYGTFRGENGFGAIGQVRINDYLVASGGMGIGTARGGVGGRAGLTLAW
ncbi:hypothetical protein [Methyloferula stellata]|uniref:hypothetical protein n=1 Tax=Methyloferula stellata TaxID=876270 RepID=UPI00037650CE|nr:hypothetical protein [Methyloferula stellata]